MEKYAFLFPGQGSQYVGMGKKLCETFPQAQEVFAEANEALGYDLQKICFEGPEAELTLTQNTQPAILTVSTAVHQVFTAETGITPSYVAGHSLGEYSALVSIGALRFSDAVKAVHERGKFMQEAVPTGTGAMAALIGGENKAIQNLCERYASSTGEVCEIANYNGGGQLVISGAKAAVEAAAKECENNESLGVRKAVMLPVSAPFHCSLMQPAAERLAVVLASMEVGDFSIPYIANVNAETNNQPANVVDLLIQQVASSVLWEQSMQLLSRLGVTKTYELGPGKVLMGLLRRIDRNIKCSPIEDPESIAKAK